LVEAFLENQSPHEIEANRYIARSQPFEILTALDVFYATQDEDIPPMPFRDQLHARLGTSARIGAKLNDVGPWLDVGALHIPGKNSEISEKVRSELIFLYPIFGKAIGTGRIVKNLTGKYGAILSLFDKLTLGVAFVDSDGRILASNKCFRELSREGDGFKIDGNNRPISVLGDERILLDICDTAQNDTSGGYSLVALLERRSGLRPLIAKASKIKNTDVAKDTLTLMLVVDPEAASASDFSVLKALGRLTGAEFEICQLLIQGLDTESIANLRDTSVATTRTQSKTAQAKLGCKSRLDLMRPVLATSTSFSSSYTPGVV
jgi:DNA-binding CsgD family transcriptional regulator